MSHVDYRARPQLSKPVMICAFGGWNDGGEAATTAVRTLRSQWGARRFAEIDPEEFYDFQVHRPTVHLIDGTTRRIDWPTNRFSSARVGDRDAIVFIGVEPNVRWRTYCDAILQVCTDMDVDLLVTLGAFLADVPHTRPAPVSAASEDPSWLGRPGVVPARYEGPTGIVGVLNAAAARTGLPALSVWGAAPHYLPQSRNPKVALALLEAIRDLTDLEIDTGEIELAARVFEREVSEAIEEDGNLGGYVRRLEEAADSGVEADDAALEVPDGDDLAAELERYLREHDGSSDD
ncbi:MAG TPA: PAC2 family protein [Actinomycetota bacterium]|nr:PAC2 family protein [Actinomycetota bacterium]